MSPPFIRTCLTSGPPATILGTRLPSFSHSSTGAGVPIASHSSVTGSFTTTVRGLGPAVIRGGTGDAKKCHWEQQGAKGIGQAGDTTVWARQYPSMGP